MAEDDCREPGRLLQDARVWGWAESALFELLDRGVQAQLGKVLRIEAHRQGTPTPCS